MERPRVDVVVPFRGVDDDFAETCARVARLLVRDGDTVTVVDNGPRRGTPVEVPSNVRVAEAFDAGSSYHARNLGAARGDAEWILFIDADVDPDPDLLDRFFDDRPGERTAVLAGAVVDEPGGGSLSASYARLAASMSQGNTLQGGRWAYAQTASCAVRRVAFEEAGGFRRHVRSGGDADLCFRLRAAGWGIEPRFGARVTHRSRPTLRAMLGQRARHGAGAGWLEREHEGSFPREPLRRVAAWNVRSWAAAAGSLARGRRDDALVSFVDPLSMWAFELGRRMPGGNRARGAPRS